MVYKIKTLNGSKRLSTQELLQEIYAAMNEGHTEFEIDACGQHDIGGPLWTADGKPLTFKVTNPGQRLGSMGLPGTTIIVEGPTSADAGWLNAGSEITIKGDGGDTTAHCAAAGKIYVGGRVGTRSGSLMKHDPSYEAPEFWVLKNTGSFCFEFMGGGTAVVCGIDSEQFDSVLGDRACAGMVGGTVYFRGKASGISLKTTKIMELTDQDKKFLTDNIPVFLKKIDQSKLEKQLLDMSQWKKVVAKTYEERIKKSATVTLKDFRTKEWVSGGIFGDIYEDDLRVLGLVNRGDSRLRKPEWLNAFYAAPCEAGCPAGIPSQTRFQLLRDNKLEDAYKLVLEYSPFPGSVCGSVCPNLCMEACSRCAIDTPANIKNLGLQSVDIKVDLKVKDSGKKIAIVGSGVGGLTAAWLLRLRGHGVTVIEKEATIGGKIVNAVSRDRLPAEMLMKEIERLKTVGIEFKTNTTVDQKMYEELKKKYDYVILAFGAYQPKLPPWPGKEKIKPYLDFLLKVNNGERPQIGKKVVVIGCGNSGMDVISGAYKCGATEVIAIDIQKPSAFAAEVEHVKSLGAKIMFPAFTKEITDKGVVLQDGTLLEADTVFATIGDMPILNTILKDPKAERGYLTVGEDRKVEDNVYAIGDVTKLGLLADAIGHGREVALRINDALHNKPFASKPKIRIPEKRLSLGYFSAVDTTDFEGEPVKDALRCISCGTCRDCEMCLKSCPEKCITRVVDQKDGTFEYVCDETKCIGCGVCEGVCPCGIWTMKDNA
jgi:NADPH-dependent glutamate synthase beta subunit-like oxidoreductase/glutamate synthase domain-containing protein 3/Pyruvate/2-oxoacid:ferredoxin oxidoreductase delta subunit